MKKETVIASIVLYKHTEANLKRTLFSLLSQSEIGKIILVDNGGSEWASRIPDKRCVYLKSPGNIGYGAGHNLAIRKYAQNCSYFLICNPDIFFEGDVIKGLLASISKVDGGLFMPNIIYPDGRRQELCKLLPTPFDLFFRRFFPFLAAYTDKKYLLKNADFELTQFVPSLSGCFMFCKSQALIELNGFDERYFMYMEDVDLSRRFAESYGSFYIPSVRVVHDFQKGSYKNKKLMWIHIKSAIAYFNKWGWCLDKSRHDLNLSCIQNLRKKI